MPGGVPNFKNAPASHIEAAAPRSFDINDLNDGANLSSTNFVPVFDIQSTRSMKFAPGFGYRNRQYAAGWADLDLKCTPDGGSTVNDVTGEYMWRYYSDSDRTHLNYQSGQYRPRNLRNAVDSDLTDKHVLHQLSPAVNEEGWLEFAVRVPDNLEGQQIYAADSNVDEGIPYSQLNI